MPQGKPTKKENGSFSQHFYSIYSVNDLCYILPKMSGGRRGELPMKYMMTS